MRLDIRYQMNFAYAEPVREAHNEVRVRPRDMTGQRLLGYRLSTTPTTRVLSFTDYWGTTVEHFGHVQSHGRLEILAEAAVETRPRPVLESAPMSALDDQFRIDNSELLQRSPHVDWTPQHAELAREDAGRVELKQFISNLISASRQATNGGKQVEIDFRSGRLPAGEKGFFVVGHDLRLGQVLTNLIANARSFVPDKGGRI